MNYGPLEFAEYLRRRSPEQAESATIRAARAAAPPPMPLVNQLNVVTGARSLTVAARSAAVEAVSVYEAVSMHPPGSAPEPDFVRVIVKPSPASRPMVLVLSAYQGVEWRVSCQPGTRLTAVLLSGFGPSTVTGTGDAVVCRIGGFYAFRRGSAEFRHLETEVMRCTGRTIENFQSCYAGSRFEVNA
jgi:hypothetical protein